MFDNSTITKALTCIKDDLRDSLKEKYNISNDKLINGLLKVHGLHKSNFDFVKNLEEMMFEKLNDKSIDDNANKNEKTISGLQAEVTSPINKLIGFRALYRQMKKLYGKAEAKRLSKEMYDYSLIISDSTKINLPYCFSIDASRLVVEGRNFGQLHSSPAKHVSSYIAQVTETVHQLSNHVAGALAIGSFFLDITHILLFKENLSKDDLLYPQKRKSLKNEFQQFVHSVNHLSRNSLESPFSNISIFDKPKLRSLINEDNYGWYFDNKVFPNDFNYSKEEIIDYIIEVQNIFLDLFDKGDPMRDGIPYRFPIVTVNFSKVEDSNGNYYIEDKDFLQDFLRKRNILRYNIFSSEGTKVSSCCFDEGQSVVCRFNNEDPKTYTFKELDSIPDKTHYRLMNSGIWSKAKLIKIKRNNKKMFKVITKNNKEMILTEDHINVTYNGDISTKDLTINDYLLVNTSSFSSVNEKDDKLTYEQGLLIGAYLGDGSNAKGKSNCISLSLNEIKWAKLESSLEKAAIDCGEKEMLFYLSKPYNNVYPVCINSKIIKDFICKYVFGRYSHDKEINLNVLLQSEDFRKGIIDGMYITDGGNSNRIYSTSKKLIEGLDIILSSLGIMSSYNEDDRRDEKVIIREKEYNRNYISLTLRFYEKNNRSKYMDIYRKKLGNTYIGIKSIEELKDYDKDYVYCFEMKDQDDPYFTLANGIVTHNCRLISDAEMLQLGSQTNSFGGTAVSLGSHRVVTINFARLALESTSKKDFYSLLKNRIYDAARILKAHKALLQDLTDKGLQPFIANGWLKLNRMFSTFGVLGEYEADLIMKKKYGDQDYMYDMLDLLNMYVNKISKEIGIIGNIEQIPAESQAVKSCNIDKYIFGEENVPFEMYSNQFIPLWSEDSIFERLEKDGKYNQLLTGGGIVHITTGEQILTKQAEKIINMAVEVGCEHFCINGIYSQCANNHYSLGKHKACPVCGEKVIDYFTRVVGFFVSVSSMNKKRREWEFDKRTILNMEE